MSKLSEMREANLAKTAQAAAERKAADQARYDAWKAEKEAAEADPNSRRARCSCGREVASFSGLAFRQTAESHAEGRCGTCGYADVAHEEPTRSRPHLARVMSDGHEFTQAEPRDYDTYYCGCRGWD